MACAPLSAVWTSNSRRSSARSENRISGSSSTTRIGCLLVSAIVAPLGRGQKTEVRGQKAGGRRQESVLRTRYSVLGTPYSVPSTEYRVLQALIPDFWPLLP